MNEEIILRHIKKQFDKNEYSNAIVLANELHISELDILPYLKELEKLQYISVFLGGDIKLNQKGIDAIENIDKKIKLQRRTRLCSIIKAILKWIFGIIATIIGALLIWYFGLN